MGTNGDFFPINEVLHTIFKLHASEGGVTFHPMKLAILIVSIPCSFGLAWVKLVGRRKLDEVFLSQYLKNDIQWLTKGRIVSTSKLELGLWSCSYIDGISLIARPLKVGPWIVALIALLILLLVVDSLLIVWLIRWVGLILGRINNIHMSCIGNPICCNMLVLVPISRLVI